MEWILDDDYLRDQLTKLLEIPSPAGYTDAIVHHVGEELQRLGVEFELTRRGAVRANLPGELPSPDRAVVAHLDTIGAMVSGLKRNGRLAVAPVGTWPARFAESTRVSVLTQSGPRTGTILPLKASGHAFGEIVNTQPVRWDNLEIRVDEIAHGPEDLEQLGFRIGDFVALAPGLEITPSGFVVARNLDDKAGVAVLLAVAREISRREERLPVDCHLLFTISEELGSGASAVLHQDVCEMVSVDNAIAASGQNSIEQGVTVCMMDSTGPFDYHLTHKLISLCEQFEIPHSRDVFKYYRCDAASAVEAGNDLRTALVCFGLDGSHGSERTHLGSLHALGRLLLEYVRSGPSVRHDRFELGPLDGFPSVPT